MDRPVLEFRGIHKAFFGVPVLTDVSLEVRAGEVLGLVGENGAGKSTLMNVVGGILHADAGELLLGGERYAPAGPDDARAAGIGFIHQELNLFTNLSVAENLFLEAFPRRRWSPFVDRRALAARARELIAELGLDLPPNALVDTLSPGERQLVEIAKALASRARILIFDEPTTSLTAKETALLFALVRRLRAHGVAIVYITHVLSHVVELADRVAVLRNGQLVAAGPVAEFPIPRMIASMVGRDLQSIFPPRARSIRQEEALRVERLSQPGIVRGIDLSVRKGEIVGLFGLMGSGRTELARMIFGVDRYQSGSVRVCGAPLPPGNPRAAIARGLAFVTENRRDEGLLMSLPVDENIGLVALPGFARGPTRRVDGERLAQAAAAQAAELHIKAASFGAQKVKSLSGGNQQKVVIAKWLLARPRALIVDEPTRGIDVGAKYEVFVILGELARQGAGILFISSELEELMGVADRVVVMSRGEIVGEFQREGLVQEQVMGAAFRQAVGGRP